MVVVANEHFLAATHIKIKDVRRAAGVTTRQFCGFLLYFGIGQNIRKWGVAMLEKIFSFGRAKEKQSDDTTGKYRTITEEEYQRYVFEDELFKIIVETEAALHNIEDPVEIAVGVMKAACKFYGADWCGILIADLRSQLWRPEMWYDVETGPMKETLFHEFEMTEEFVTWAEHLVSQKPMIIPDTEAIRESNPKEYEAYQRLKAKAVIGVPFGQHPLGYMVVRNPVRNISQPEPLQLACFVAMMMVLQKRRIDAERRYISDVTPEEGKLKMRYNILGQHSMDINGQRIREQDLAHPNRRGWVILLYLILHKAPVDQLSMAAELWPDESEKSVRANIRQAIYRLHSDLAVYHDAKVIDVKSGMLELLDDVHIVTDAEEMESLYLKAKSTATSDEKAAILKKAFELYQGRLFELGELDMGSWLIPYTTHYNQVFIDITRELLSMLGHSRDYHRVIEYASRALSLEPGIQDAYYWISIAAEATGNSMMKDRYDQMAREELAEEEYQKVQHLLEIRTHPTE